VFIFLCALFDFFFLLFDRKGRIEVKIERVSSSGFKSIQKAKRFWCIAFVGSIWYFGKIGESVPSGRIDLSEAGILAEDPNTNCILLKFKMTEKQSSISRISMKIPSTRKLFLPGMSTDYCTATLRLGSQNEYMGWSRLLVRLLQDLPDISLNPP